MDQSSHQYARECQAELEVGVTDVRPPVARILMGVFVVVIAAAGAIQRFGTVSGPNPAPDPAVTSPCDPVTMFRDARSVFATDDGGLMSAVVAANRVVLAGLRRCEDHLEDESVVGRAIRPTVQSFLARTLGAGNEQVYLGRDGWLFYRPDVDYVVGPGFLDRSQWARRAAAAVEWRSPPHPDPRPAIIDFRDQLARRNIELIVIPTPVKPTMHPEYLASAGLTRLQNRSYREFIGDLEEAGVVVFDAADVLASLRTARDGPTYLATDTHWRPIAMQRVASALAAIVRLRLGLVTRPTGTERPATVTVRGRGDLLAMLDVSTDDDHFSREQVDIHPVGTVAEAPLAVGDVASVLLLGDSFSNIYSLATMGWGTGAGLAEQLAFELQQPIDRIIRNDNGAFATRDALARELSQGRDRLAGKQVVLYQFATRELAFGDWKLIALPTAPGPAAVGFVELSAGQSRVITGTIAAASDVPRPESVPYRDHVRTLHLVDVGVVDGALGVSVTDALVYVRSMQDSVWTPAAAWRPGQRLTLRVHAWEDVSSDYDGLNRSELDDERLLLVEPVWGELR